MRKFFTLLFLPLLVLTAGFSFAQSADTFPSPPGFDFKAWGSSAGVYALFVVFAVALLKRRFPQLTGGWVLLVSLVLSEIGAFLLYRAGFLTDPSYVSLTPPWVWLAFGLAAFVTSSGGYAALLQFAEARAVVKQKVAQALPAPVQTGTVFLTAGSAQDTSQTPTSPLR